MYCRAAALLLLLAGCGTPRKPPVERIAVLRFENLSGDASIEWTGRGFSELITGALAGSPGVYAIPFDTLHSLDRTLGGRALAAPGISAERTQAVLGGATRIVYGRYRRSGGEWRLDANVEDPAANRILRAVSASGRDPFEAAAALARELSPAARALATRSEPALKEYAAALESGEAGALERALAADPDFGVAWLRLSAVALAGGGRGAAQTVLEKAVARPLPPLERARAEAELATLRGDAAARERALQALIQAAPADPEPYRILAAASASAHQYGRAAGQLRQAAERMPANAALLNQLGYMEAFAGNLPAGVAALREYERLRPGEANPLDSLGDVNAAHGRFAEAVRAYLDAYGRDPNFLDGGTLFKAAQARLMAGDRAGADGLFGRYLEARRAAGDPVLEYRRAEWEWQTGRGRDALERLQRFAAKFQDPAGRAWGDVAVWQFLSGNREAARAAALRTQLPLVRFWVEAGNSGDPRWSSRQRELAGACKFLLQSDFASAVAPLERLYAGWEPGADPAIPVLLAWAYQETGHPERAVPLVESYPIPRNAGLSPAGVLWFPRYFYVRGAVLASRGKAAEAQRAWRTFLDLSGPDDDIWRLRSRAREALASR